jgi:multiple sugar transport system ATP-binding protein
MAGVSLQRIKKAFGEVEVIPGLDLDIADKEFVVLVGPSGCGKTTTLRMIAGLELPTSGTVRIGERDVTGLRPGLRNCSMVFQNYALYPHMTVKDNIGYGMKVRGTPPAEIEAAVDKAARILEIGDYLDRRPKHLSGGQRQRVAIGRAIVREPDVFLFDEPLSNLDAKLRVEMRTEIKSLHRRLATTIVYVTHDQVEAMTMADRVVVMHQGRIEQAADPITLYQQPANRFVAAFIGAPAMNFLDGRLARDDGLVFQADEGARLTVPLDRADRYARHLDRKLTLGIRPEHCTGVGDDRVPLAIVAVEPLGPHTLLVGHVGRTPFTAQVPPSFAADADTVVEVGVDSGQMHLFDHETGTVL